MSVDFSTLAVAGGLSALVAGATGSLHCALMCGPLACAAVPSAPGARRRRAAAWHVGRVSAYVGLGLALGLVGKGLTQGLAVSVQSWLPWVMAAGLLASAFELGKRLGPVPGFSFLARKLAVAGRALPEALRPAALGAATPFLPCGLLYGMFLAAAGTGTASGGALVMGLFALGGTPALAATQAGTGLSLRFPRAAWVLRRAVPVAAAAVLIARALAASPEAPPACH